MSYGSSHLLITQNNPPPSSGSGVTLGITAAGNAVVASTPTASPPGVTTISATIGSSVPGKLLLAIAALDKDAGALSVGAGWTLLGPTYEGPSVSQAMAYRVADGTSADLTCTFNWTIAQACIAQVFQTDATLDGTPTGVVAPNPEDDVAVTSISADAGAATESGFALAAVSVDSSAGPGWQTTKPTWSNGYTQLAFAMVGQASHGATPPTNNFGDAAFVIAAKPITSGTTTLTTLTSGGTTEQHVLRVVRVPSGAAPSGNPLLSSFSDNFASQDTTKWTYGTGVVATGGRLEITPTTAYQGVYGKTVSSLVGSYGHVELAQAPNVGSGTTEVLYNLEKDGQNYLRWALSGTSLLTQTRIAGTTANRVFLTFDPVLHRWWRIREAAGVIYWETSPDRSTWTVRDSGAVGLDVSAVYPALLSGYYGTEPSPGITAFDNFNVAPGPLPTVAHRIVDIPTTTAALVKARTTNSTSVRLKVGTNPAVTTGVVYGTAATPDASGNVTLPVSGLTAGIQYYYRLAMTDSSGAEVLDTLSTVGEFKTAPSGPASFNFAFGSCDDFADSTIFSNIASWDPDLFFHLGDWYYSDGTGTDLANIRSKMLARLQGANHQALYATTPMSYTPSDHDAAANGTTMGSDATGWTNWNSAYRELIPASGIPATTGVYRTFTWGRVRFIQLDTRSFSSAPTATDNSSKTFLGATQKQWLKDTITAAVEPVIVILQESPWVGTGETDSWGGYSTERTELANFFVSSGKADRIKMLAGDMHALAGDDGTNAPGGISVWHAAPLHNNSSNIKGGPYTHGPWPNPAVTATVQNHGRVTVTDNGSTITLAYSGWDAVAGVQRISTSETVTTASPTVAIIRSARAASSSTRALLASKQAVMVRSARSASSATQPKPTVRQVLAVRGSRSSSSATRALLGSKQAVVVRPSRSASSTTRPKPTVRQVLTVRSARSASSATRALLVSKQAVVVRPSRSATSATRALLTARRSTAVRSAQSGTSATRPLLAVRAALDAVDASSSTRASRPLVGQRTPLDALDAASQTSATRAAPQSSLSVAIRPSRAVTSATRPVLTHHRALVVLSARAASKATRALLAVRTPTTVRSARAVTSATRPALAHRRALVVLSARAASKATRPLLVVRSSTTVRSALAATKAIRPLLGHRRVLVVLSARAASKATRALLPHRTQLVVWAARSGTLATRPKATHRTILAVRSSRASTSITMPRAYLSGSVQVRASRASSSITRPRLSAHTPLSVIDARSEATAAQAVLGQRHAVIARGARARTTATRALASTHTPLLVVDARSGTTAARARLGKRHIFVVLGSRAHTTAARMLLALSSKLLVRSAKSASRITRSRLAQYTPLGVQGARADSTVPVVRLGSVMPLVVRKVRAPTWATRLRLTHHSILTVRPARAPTAVEQVVLPGSVFPSAPPERTLVVPLDLRVFEVLPDSRGYTVPPDLRSRTATA